MATDVLEQQQTDPEEPQTEERNAKFRLTKKVKILLLLVLVMAVEAGGFLLLVPGGSAGPDEESADAADVETVEVEVDNFKASNANAAPGRLFQVELKLIGVVAKDQEVTFRLAATKDHKGLVKQEVESVMASASLEELRDSNRSMIKRRIKEKVNKALGRSYLIKVILNDFHFFSL